MSEWREVTLAELGKFSSGKPITPGQRGEFNAYGANGVIGGSDEARYGSGIIVGRVGAYCGAVAVSHEPFWASDNTIVIEPAIDDDLDYLGYLLRSAHLHRYAGGAAQPLVTQGILKALRFRVPEPNVRVRIGRVLADFDDLIENNRRRVEILEEMARSIYREWFVKFRYPGHEDVPLVDSALGPMPEGWEHRRLFDAADVGFGYSFKSPRFSAQGPNQVIRIRDIPAGISSTFTDEVVIPRYAVSDDDVLVGMDGDFHMTVWTGGDAWLNQRVTRLRSLAGMSNLQLLLSIENQIVTWNKSIVGTTVAHLGKKHLELVTVLVSDGSTLERANAVFQPIMEQRRSLIQASRRLEALRDHLLPKLVTGQIDLSALDLDVLLVEEVA